MSHQLSSETCAAASKLETCATIHCSLDYEAHRLCISWPWLCVIVLTADTILMAVRGLAQDHLSGLGLFDKLLPLLERLRVIFPVLFLLILFLIGKVLFPTKSGNPALTMVIRVYVLLNTLGCDYISCTTIPFLVQKDILHQIHEETGLYRKV